MNANRVFAAATALEDMLKQTPQPNETITTMIQNQLQSVSVTLEEVFHSIQKMLLD
ncbi:hypothetical protein [Paenibacillus sp. yr247]|uniref:hypothetical protein n=1 Tax=Paenibacillus sp. yr247 TaxID=1761880 RepID=UPI00158733D8|nr:hypothetical protein [Paenibacillus sp. yr247]